MRPSWLGVLLGALWVATAIHVDWHLARHGHDALSFGFGLHWLLAIPVFALLTWFLNRRSPGDSWLQGLVAITIGVLLGQILEPLWEGGGAIRNPERLKAFGWFMATGLLTWFLTYRLFRRDATTSSRGER